MILPKAAVGVVLLIWLAIWLYLLIKNIDLLEALWQLDNKKIFWVGLALSLFLHVGTSCVIWTFVL